MRRITAPLVGALVTLTVLLLGAGPASAALSDVPTPTVTGPIPVTADSTPWAATDKPLGDYGYVEDEYLYGGDAYRYDTTGDVDQTGTRITTGGPADDGAFPYQTRMIVRRPADPDDFNGTVVVEWQNVTAGFDLEANWFGDPEYLLENGYAYVAVSAQRVGVNWLRSWDAGRYGELDVSARDAGTETITNDALSYDIYAAAIKALLDGADGTDPLGELPKPDTVIASGESQSGSRLSAYYNKIQPIHDVVDAFLITVSSGPIRHDTSTPVIRVLSETENRIPRTEADDDNYRQWEVAGGSHLPRMAFENFQAPIERDIGITLSASCLKYPLSRVQWPFVVNSAYEHLIEWASGGDAPPIAPRGVYQDDPEDASNQLVRDENGIAEGAIRLPEMSVPARVNTGVNAADPAGGGVFSAFCGLLGSTEDLSDSVLLSRYDDWADYVGQASQAAEDVADQGFILDQDVPRLIQMHREVPNLRPTAPHRRSGGRQNTGLLALAWRGTEAPQTTFEVEHSSDGGVSWSAVPGADALTERSFEFTGEGEAEGGWIYRVRSHTTIPADAARDEFVITTPWSEASGTTTVDRTKPKLRLRCPRKVSVGKRAFVRIDASDKGVGLRKDPSGKRRVPSGRKGVRTYRIKAVDAAGNKTTRTCKVKVRRAHGKGRT
jgi:hypothetical protein